jgi:hypothetical protein
LNKVRLQWKAAVVAWKFIPGVKRNSSKKKGASMGKKTALVLAVVSISFFLVLAMGNAWAEMKVGDAAPKFMLATTQDKPVSYTDDYYGKHHLVLQFFANAFGGG